MSIILLYAPNIVGYFRIAFLWLAFIYVQANGYYFIFLYGMSYLLDAFDGFLARKLNQSTKFGQVFDQVIDRVSSACLFGCMMIIDRESYYYYFIFMFLDVFCHFLWISYSFILNLETHKDSENWIIRTYYKKPILFSLCALEQLAIVSIYCLKMELLILPTDLIRLFVFGLVIKHFTNIVQAYEAAKGLCAYEKIMNDKISKNS